MNAAKKGGGLTPSRQRMLFVVCAVLLCALAVQFAMVAFRENIVFFLTPGELLEGKRTGNVRLGGLVLKGSVQHAKPSGLNFTVTDGAAEIRVHYDGVPPSLFREGQGVVAEGSLQADGTFLARSVLAKHDEKYMPPEVAAKLKETGRWREGEPAPVP